MQDKPTYEELAEAIAHCVYARLYVAEPYENRWMKNVDNYCATYYQIPTAVLTGFGILKPLDDLHRRNVFTCFPDDFRSKIVENKRQGCGYDELVLAMICLLERHPNQPDIHDYLAALGVCEPYVDEGKSRFGPDVDVKWTTKREHYKELTKDWDWGVQLYSVPFEK